MKTSTLRNVAGLALAFFVTLPGTHAADDTDSGAQLSLGRPGGGTNRVNLADAADRTWTIRSSRDLVNWTMVDTLKPFNGTYRRDYAGSGDGNLFFRADPAAASAAIASTTANALGLPATPFNYAAPPLPASFAVNPILAEDNTPAANPTTDAGATLGRVLFYDRRLSTNGTIACASCHRQANGFADPRQFSIGHDGSTGARNAMGLSNARWYQRQSYFWDERAATLETQTLLPIQNPIEMGMTLTALTNRLAAEPFYTNLFTAAFGSADVTADRISRALAQFVRSIVTAQSKYDLGVTNNFANFTDEENLGRQIFFGQTGTPRATCAVCHATDNFVPTTTLNNNGLEYPYVDLGVGGITGTTADQGKFKVPSLRNIERTAPYMHDGRFTNLEQVVAFYSSGVVSNPNLSPPLAWPGGTPLRLNLTAAQQSALVAFLKTLTDTNLVTSPALSNPFNYGD